MKATRPSAQAKAPAPRPANVALFDKENYLWMLIGVGILIVGFLLMAGGSSNNPNEFIVQNVYSPRRITVAPIVILLGLAVEIYALIRQPKTPKAAEQ